MGTLVVMLVLGLLAWLWMDALRARERVLALCKDASQDLGVQLLDQTVAMVQMGLGRNEYGRIQIRRRYQFEFSTNGHDRLTGHAVLFGKRLELLQMDFPDGAVILPVSQAGAGLY
jgi:hypothetical protein